MDTYLSYNYGDNQSLARSCPVGPGSGQQTPSGWPCSSKSDVAGSCVRDADTEGPTTPRYLRPTGTDLGYQVSTVGTCWHLPVDGLPAARRGLRLRLRLRLSSNPSTGWCRQSPPPPKQHHLLAGGGLLPTPSSGFLSFLGASAWPPCSFLVWPPSMSPSCPALLCCRSFLLHVSPARRQVASLYPPAPAPRYLLPACLPPASRRQQTSPPLAVPYLPGRAVPSQLSPCDPCLLVPSLPSGYLKHKPRPDLTSIVCRRCASSSASFLSRDTRHREDP